MAPFETVAYEPGRRAAFLGLMREVWDGDAWSEDEFAWWFERNPAGSFVISLAEEEGRTLGAVAQSYVRLVLGGEPVRATLTLHAMTGPGARGKGVFSALQQRNEETAGAAGAVASVAFPNGAAGPIFVNRLGWQELCRPRIWARPKRPLRALRRRGAAGGALRGTLEELGPRHEELYRRASASWPAHLDRDAATLDWRYRDSPRPYASVTTERGFAVVGLGVFRGVSAGLVCELVGEGAADLLRRSIRLVDADLVLALPNPGEHAAYLAAGFVPTPATLRFVGRALRPGVVLPRGRAAWRLSLGDADIF